MATAAGQAPVDALATGQSSAYPVVAELDTIDGWVRALSHVETECVDLIPPWLKRDRSDIRLVVLIHAGMSLVRGCLLEQDDRGASRIHSRLEPRQRDPARQRKVLPEA